MIKIGLIADTHIPARWPRVPANLSEIFKGVDLLLHAGDVGALTVLDELSQLAPVIAVHGNDDSAEAARELPEQQLLAIHGRRILLWHSHYPDRKAETAARRSGEISPARNLHRARETGAEIVVFGHWHIPFSHSANGVLIINPGAIASGNEMLRQTVQSVAILTLKALGGTAVTHFNLAHPQKPFVPRIDWQAGFAANHDRYAASILAPRLQERWRLVYQQLEPDEKKVVLAAYMRLAHRCWADELGEITAVRVQEEMADDPAISAALRRRLSLLLNSSD